MITGFAVLAAICAEAQCRMRHPDRKPGRGAWTRTGWSACGHPRYRS